MRELPAIGELLTADVERSVSEGIRWNGGDPRLDDIGRLNMLTTNDRLRHLLSCLTLSAERRSHQSDRDFAVHLGIDPVKDYPTRR